MSVQSLNGDSYQGPQVGANVQSQVGTSKGHLEPEPSVVWALPASVQKEGRIETNRSTTKPNRNRQPLSWGSRPHLVNAFGSGLSITPGRRSRSEGTRCSVLTAPDGQRGC